MDIFDNFPSGLMKADDLQGQTQNKTIESVALEEVAAGESKPVLRFVGEQKGMVLNKTNATTIASAYGRETSAWVGKSLMLFATTVSFQGRMVPAIRVAAAPAQPAAPQPAPQQQTLPTDAAPAAAQPTTSDSWA